LITPIHIHRVFSIALTFEQFDTLLEAHVLAEGIDGPTDLSAV